MVDLVTISDSDAVINKNKVAKGLNIVFSQLKEELEDHLDAINQNTGEIQSNYEYLCNVDQKISQLNNKMDEIQKMLSKFTGKKVTKMPKFSDIDPLNTNEKTVFLNLYTEDQPISYAEFASKINMPIDITREYITNLMEKGVPVQKTYIQTKPYIYLDPKFKNLQAKKNVLKIEQRILV